MGVVPLLLAAFDRPRSTIVAGSTLTLLCITAAAERWTGTRSQGQSQVLADLARLETSRALRGRVSGPSLRATRRAGGRGGQAGGGSGGGLMHAEQPGTDSDAVAGCSSDGGSDDSSDGGDVDEGGGGSRGGGARPQETTKVSCSCSEQLWFHSRLGLWRLSRSIIAQRACCCRT